MTYLEEFMESFNMGMDIEFFLYDVRYNISWRNYKPFICVCPDGDAVFYNNADQLMDEYLVDGKQLKELWKDFCIIAM